MKPVNREMQLRSEGNAKSKSVKKALQTVEKAKQEPQKQVVVHKPNGETVKRNVNTGSKVAAGTKTAAKPKPRTIKKKDNIFKPRKGG